ncbi:thioredoxin reductase [Clostridia bacterium]|nr:thioredoxin reductase [Clostridia bacterium]
MRDLIVLGGGPAGLSAAIYARRAGLSVLVLERFAAGGQLMNTPEIDNYPGLPNIKGWELAERLEQHAVSLGTEIQLASVSAISQNRENFDISAGNGIIPCRAVIFALGASRRKLGCAGEDEFAGRGVSYCATCDGNFFKGKAVAVVGGGDTALEDALYLENLGCKVTLIHRRREFRASSTLTDKILKSEITLKLERNISAIGGNAAVESVTLDDGEVLNVSGVFVAVGVIPNTEMLRGIVKLSPSGHILTNENCRTEIPCLYAAGDAREKELYQVVTAASDGANAASAAARDLNQRDIR